MSVILLWLFKLLMNHHYHQVNLPGGSIKRNNLNDATVALYLAYNEETKILFSWAEGVVHYSLS
jgi:hypothetical protein